MSRSVSFDSHGWAKSDITHATYELSDLLRHSCVCLPHILNNFVVSFMYIAVGFKILFFWLPTISWSANFDSHGWTQKSDITLATYELSDLLGRSCVCLPHILHKFTFSFMYLALGFKIKYSCFIPYLASLASIYIVELKNII